MVRRFLFLLCLLLLPAAVQARGIEPQLVAEGPAQPGGEVELAIVMHTAPGWHGYWLNPGDAGLPMDIQWQLPKGFTVGPLRYPVPSRLTVAGLMNYVYERDYALLIRLKVPADAKGSVPVRAHARWLACTDKVCVPEQGDLSLDLPVGTGTPQRPQFDAWRKLLPRPLASVGHFAMVGGKLVVAIPLPANVDVHDPYVFPITDNAVDYEAKQDFRRARDLLVAEIQAKGMKPSGFDGIVALGNGEGLEFKAVPGLVPMGGKRLGELGAGAMLAAILGALVGGILLNLMPCVFPILALKALHLARASEGPRAARTDALAYTAGAVVGTGALGLILLVIRAAGSEAGWAFQLQDPRTVMLLLLLAVAITANLLGLFELPVLGGSARPAGSFGTGALAAFVATPCAGPFLGAALGTALLLPMASAVLVFGALGLGLALPFLLIAFVPSLARLLPKPGAWMKRLQRFLAIPMAATAVAALWLLYRQTGQNGFLNGAVGALAAFNLLRTVGDAQRKGWTIWSFAWASFSLVIIPAAFVFVARDARTVEQNVVGAEVWADGKAERYVAQGHPVFVYFTADWCLTCKANEAAAIDRTEVRDAFRQAGVKVLAGDWTNGDPAITRFLDAHGRAGVPFYLWYASGKQPEELPQLLTPGMLTDRARSAKP